MAIKPRRRAVHFVLRAGTRWPGGICVRTGPSARTRVDQRRERDTSHGACGLSCLPQETEEGWRAARVDGRLGFRTRGKCCTSTYVPRMPASLLLVVRAGTKQCARRQLGDGEGVRGLGPLRRRGRAHRRSLTSTVPVSGRAPRGMISTVCVLLRGRALPRPAAPRGNVDREDEGRRAAAGTRQGIRRVVAGAAWLRPLAGAHVCGAPASEESNSATASETSLAVVRGSGVHAVEG